MSLPSGSGIGQPVIRAVLPVAEVTLLKDLIARTESPQTLITGHSSGRTPRLSLQLMRFMARALERRTAFNCRTVCGQEQGQAYELDI